MFPMRLKLGTERNKEWRCCFCLHVRTATVLFGIWHLVLHILALTVLALIMKNHHVTVQRSEHFPENDFLPTPLSKIREDDNPYYLPTTQDGRPIYSSDIDMGALMTVCTLSITLLMVYGTIKGKATHLLPFFCLQLFDFAVTTLTATGYFCYLRSAHRLIDEHWNLPLRHELLQLSPQVLTLIVLIAFLFAMLWKAYWISVIWRCYKYLTLRQNASRTSIHYIIPDAERRCNTDAEFAFFRDQEAAFGGPLKQTPPPSYQDVMDEQPPPYANVEVVRDGECAGALEAEGPSVSNISQDFPARIEADVEVTPNVSGTSTESENDTFGAQSTAEGTNGEQDVVRETACASGLNSPKK